ncbi:MAG: large conductance mechanosensitive channel protein MscL [Candidatus Avilachnospira sp.]|jgi:large conductance mechanosensitive channel
MIKKLMEEFKTFALRGNVMDMAVGVIVGGAFSDIVTSLTENILKPIINLCMGSQLYSLDDIKNFGASFISSIVNFVIMAFILFMLLKFVNKLLTIGIKKEEEPAAPTTKVCPYCKSEISIEATRCPHCTSELDK